VKARDDTNPRAVVFFLERASDKVAMGFVARCYWVQWADAGGGKDKERKKGNKGRQQRLLVWTPAALAEGEAFK